MNLKFTYLLALMLLVTGCSNDDDSPNYPDVDGLAPTITMEASSFKAEPGREFEFVGTIKDNDGLRSVHLYCPEIYLDKTIDLLRNDSLIYVYDLEYKFKVADSIAVTRSFSTVITATDVGGRTAEATVSFTMDGDFVAPTFPTRPDTQIMVLFEPNTVEPTTTLNLQFTVEDNMQLEYVEIEIPDAPINFFERVETFTNILGTTGTELVYERDIDFPTTEASYTLNVTAMDAQGNTSGFTSTIVVTDQLPDYGKIYLADVATAAALNSDIYGVPMMVERTDEYTYTARYRNYAAGTEIYFIPQKTDFSPIRIGRDASTDGMISYNGTERPFVLDQLAYYRIVINTREKTYTMETYVPNDSPVNYGEQLDDEGTPYTLAIGLAGEPFPGYNNWDPSAMPMLTQDSANPFLLYADLQLTRSTSPSLEFTITPYHPRGWWIEPFWRFDNATAEEAHILNGGSNMTKQAIPATGVYRFEFDTHLLRSKLYPKN